MEGMIMDQIWSGSSQVEHFGSMYTLNSNQICLLIGLKAPT